MNEGGKAKARLTIVVALRNRFPAPYLVTRDTRTDLPVEDRLGVIRRWTEPAHSPKDISVAVRPLHHGSQRCNLERSGDLYRDSAV
jgi:hypothetical protein